MANTIFTSGLKIAKLGEIAGAEDVKLAPGAGFNVNVSSAKLMGVADATLGTDAPNLAQTQALIDTAVDGLSTKQPVRVATTANIDLATATAVDGVTLAEGDRVLVKDQTADAENGIYEFVGGALQRASDADGADDLVSAFVFVSEGTSADLGFTCTNDAGFTLDTDPVTWAVRGSSTIPDATDTLAGKVRLADATELTNQAGTGIPNVTQVKAIADDVAGDFLPLAGGTMNTNASIITEGIFSLEATVSGNTVTSIDMASTILFKNDFGPYLSQMTLETNGLAIIGDVYNPNYFGADYKHEQVSDLVIANSTPNTLMPKKYIDDKLTEATSVYQQDVNYADLTGGNITITHNLNKTLPSTFIAYWQGEVTHVPMSPVDANSVTLDLSAFGDFTAQGAFTIILG